MTVKMTQEEQMRLKEELLSFVQRVTDERNLIKMPEEVEALPAIVQILLGWF